LKKTFNLDVNLSDAVQEMWDLDANRLTPNVDYTINVQGGKKPYQKDDDAPDPLFTSVDEREALKRPTYIHFVKLLDNYETKTGVVEKHSSTERGEIDAFLDSIMQTGPMQYCHKYVRAKKGSEIPSSASEFKELLFKIWFDFYRRDGATDSSGMYCKILENSPLDKVCSMNKYINV
jgi:poly(U)-specific endoribonuclease